MEVVITEWALDSYLNLKHERAFSDEEYRETLRPDVELLKDGYPSSHEKFKNDKFWGPATDLSGNIAHGFKMKWHQVGSGKVQLRLAVAIASGMAFLCRGYVKKDEKVDRREMARFKIQIRNIFTGNYQYRGKL